MAQRQLKKVFQTRKINSLPEDLRKIADELLIEKFGEEDTVKEVRKKSSSPFPDYIIQEGLGMGRVVSSEYAARFDGTIHESNVDYGRMGRRPEVTARCNPYDRTRVATTPITEPTFRGLIEALRRFDEQNLPRRDRIFRLEPQFWNYLKRDDEINLHISSRTYEEFTILGCRIIVDPAQSNELEVRF